MNNKETIESSIVQCRECGETKTRIMDGRYPNKKDTKWIDPISKKQWSGHLCSVCVVELARKRKQAKTRSSKVISG